METMPNIEIFQFYSRLSRHVFTGTSKRRKAFNSIVDYQLTISKIIAEREGTSIL